MEFTVAQAEEYLHKHKITVKNKVIELKHGVGLKTLSYVDFLCNFHNYILKFTHKGTA